MATNAALAASLAHQSYYPFTPSKPLAIVAATFYSLAFVGTIFQCIRYRSWVWSVMVLASLMEAMGYIARILSVDDVYAKNRYIVQYCMIVLAPVFMAAACYVLFTRIVFHIVPRTSCTLRLLWIPARWITPIFVLCDIVALGLQLVGAVRISSIELTDPDFVEKAKKGKEIAQIGVAVQLACFGLFSVIAVRFNFTSKRFMNSFNERVASSEGGEKYCVIDRGERRLKRNWQAILRVTNFASAMILIRSVYRMVGFTLGRKGYTAKHEWTLYVFDTLVIFPVVALYIPWHPAKYLPYLGFRMPKYEHA